MRTRLKDYLLYLTVKWTDHLRKTLFNQNSEHQAFYETGYFISSCAFNPSNKCDTSSIILTSALQYCTPLHSLLDVICERNVVTTAVTVRVYADRKGLAQPVVWYRDRKQDVSTETLWRTYLGLIVPTYFSDFRLIIFIKVTRLQAGGPRNHN